MTRGIRVRPLVLSSAPALIPLLFALAMPGGISAQSYPDVPPSTWSTSDDRDPTSIDWSDDVPAHIAIIEGAAWLERDNTVEAAAENVPLLAGDRLRTERGRLEVLFADGTVLDLDERTTVDLLSDSLMRMQRGRVRLSLARVSSSTDYRIDAAGTSAVLRPAGEYRLTVDDTTRTTPRIAVTVIHGAAELSSRYGHAQLRAGFEAWATATSEPTPPYIASVAFWDAFDRWTDDQHRAYASAESARYLPAGITTYGGLFDHYGSWQYDTSYGYVWYPRVDTSWRPYYQGRWSFVGSFGWVWVGADRWSWPTHHYGRWGMNGSRWYWIPDHRWAPAWVAWAEAPGYVGWSPLGYNNHAIVSINVGYASTWRAWTAVPVGRYSNTIIVDGRSRASSFPDARFVERGSAPWRAVTVTTSRQLPLRGPGRGATALQRGSVRSPIEIDDARVGAARMIVPRTAPRAAANGMLGTAPSPGRRAADGIVAPLTTRPLPSGSRSPRSATISGTTPSRQGATTNTSVPRARAGVIPPAGSAMLRTEQGNQVARTPGIQGQRGQGTSVPGAQGPRGGTWGQARAPESPAPRIEGSTGTISPHGRAPQGSGIQESPRPSAPVPQPRAEPGRATPRSAPPSGAGNSGGGSSGSGSSGGAGRARGRNR